MQTTTIVFKTDVVKEFRIPSGAIVSSTSSPPGSSTMRPPPPPPPPKLKILENKLEEPSSSIPDLVVRQKGALLVTPGFSPPLTFTETFISACGKAIFPRPRVLENQIFTRTRPLERKREICKLRRDF
ncbi:unnamed protein product [Brassicogethes aeneus]|uniref:Uncharacterized protein n=1 Tax=Brassicogethes aeneus TaxID=1431903 RepID=A0A9P0B3B2_BRAAE|nr:unnamed protein product [Brassicogethes aeneus]